MAAFIQKRPFPHPHPQHFPCPIPGCGGIDSAGHGLPCSRHSCKRKTCPLPKAEGSGYCREHACDLVACSKSRLDTSRFCNAHACQYFQCTRCKRGVGTPRGAYGDACEEHTCQADGCLDPRRHKRSYCREHSCRWSGRVGCNQAVEAGTLACRDHVCRYEEGCANVRKVKSNSTACDEHTCAAPKCYGAVGLRGKYCPEHTCLWDPCSKKAGVKGYCETHTCENPACQAPVASKMDWFCEKHKCHYSGSGCRGGWTTSPPYCEDHTCAREACDAPVRRGGGCCVPHTCTFTPRAAGEHACVRGRRIGGPLCDSHSCDKCNKPRLPNVTRCPSHWKTHPRDHPQYEHHKRRGNLPSGWGLAEEEQESKDLVSKEASAKRTVLKPGGSPPPRSALPPERAMELMTATKERGELTAASGRLDLIPSTFRADPNQAMAYGYGFRDACNHMADMMTKQMEMMGTERPMSPSRHMAKIDGPRFTQLTD